MANMRAYAQMVDKAEEHSIPRMYPTDLYCVDRAFMEWDYAPRQFGWILRDCGTHLIIHREDVASVEYWTEDKHGARQDEMFYLYWYDGHNLEDVSSEEMKRRARRLDPFEVVKARIESGCGGSVGANPFVALHNRNTQLHMQEAARRGRTQDQWSFAYVSDYPPCGVHHTHGDLRYIRGIGHTEQLYGPRYQRAIDLIDATS